MEPRHDSKQHLKEEVTHVTSVANRSRLTTETILRRDVHVIIYIYIWGVGGWWVGGLCMYVLMYVCIYECSYVRTYICTYVYICIYVCMCVCIYVCLDIRMYVCVYVYMYVRMCICMYVYMYIHVCNTCAWFCHIKYRCCLIPIQYNTESLNKTSPSLSLSSATWRWRHGFSSI